MTIEEFNKIIAEFMGATFYEPWACKDFGYHLPIYMMSNNEDVFPNGKRWHEENLLYHSSWDWLMPVWREWVNKAATLKNKSKEIGTEFFDHKSTTEHFIVCVDIKEAHRCLCLAIQWYNTQHPKNLK